MDEASEESWRLVQVNKRAFMNSPLSCKCETACLQAGVMFAVLPALKDKASVSFMH